MKAKIVFLNIVILFIFQTVACSGNLSSTEKDLDEARILRDFQRVLSGSANREYVAFATQSLTENLFVRFCSRYGAKDVEDDMAVVLAAGLFQLHGEGLSIAKELADPLLLRWIFERSPKIEQDILRIQTPSGNSRVLLQFSGAGPSPISYPDSMKAVLESPDTYDEAAQAFGRWIERQATDEKLKGLVEAFELKVLEPVK